MQKKAFVERLAQLRATAPLVHNITNYVVMNNTANALLAAGASPVMAHADEEVEEITQISSALVLNIGTLSPTWIEAMLKAGQQAKATQTPLILDPVGAGASQLRNTTCARILEVCPPDIIRGNASEIMALADTQIQTKGVDSTQESNEALATAIALAKQLNNVIVISGEVDYITDGTRVAALRHGSWLMAKITGMGCTATALIGAFAACTNDYYQAAVDAMLLMGVAGERAAHKAQGPGSFQMHFLDALHQINDLRHIEALKITSHNA